MRYITFALAKGRLATQSMKLFETIDIRCDEMNKNSRKLVFVNKELKYKFFLSKASDVPTYVEYGAADIGIVGRDTLLEEKRNLYEVLELGFGNCKMVVAGTESLKDKYTNVYNLRVATKYPQIAKEHFYKKHQSVEIIKLNGSVELGPVVGLCDVIVDLVETGVTLKENGLQIYEEVLDISARMIVNRVSMKMENQRINELIEKLKSARNIND